MKEKEPYHAMCNTMKKKTSIPIPLGNQEKCYNQATNQPTQHNTTYLPPF